MKTHSCDHETLLGRSKLAIHNNSHSICKEKPKIRIVHIVAPEIIETDVENFRSLVQRLTGNPIGRMSGNIMKKKGKSISTLQKKKKTDNSNNHLNFLGEGYMHGMNINAFPFRSNSQINTFDHMPLC